jgi:DNA-binding transcriptional ArsR family regulator
MGDYSKKARAIQHPVRALMMMTIDDRHLTPRQIAALLEGVPLGTIYRHLNILLEAGLVEVVGERRVKGTVERTFTVVASEVYLSPTDREKLTADDIMGYVSTLTGTVRAAFDRYTRKATMPPKEGDVAFLAQTLYLTPEEYAEFRQQMLSLLGKVGRQAGPGYERRMIGFFSVLEPEVNVDHEETEPPSAAS